MFRNICRLLAMGVFVGMSCMLHAQSASSSRPAASVPSEAAVAAAVALLRTTADPKQLVEAIRVVAQSSNDEAWKALREVLVDPGRIKVLEIGPPGLDMGNVTISYALPWYGAALVAVCEAQPSRANSTFVWLAGQTPYNRREGGRWPYLLYDAAQYLRAPDAAVMDVYSKTLSQTDLIETTKGYILQALAAHATPESIDLYKKYKVYGTIVDLLTYRNRYLTLQYFIERYASVTDEKEAPNLINGLLTSRYKIHNRGGEYEITLPNPIDPSPADASKFADLLEKLRTVPAKVSLTIEQDQKLSEFVAKLRTAAAKSPATQK